MSRIDVLNEAFDDIEAAPPAEEEAAPVEAAPEPESAAAPEESAPVAEETAAEKAERVRDEQGRFAKAEAAAKKAAAAPKAEKAPAAAPVKPAAAAPVAPVAPVAAPVKAPQSWKPAAREAFAKAPPEVQAEALRREAEVTRVLNETADARRVAEQVKQTLAPYEEIARLNRMEPMQYVGSVLNTALVLERGSPQQKAAVVAQLIAGYGLDVEAINAAMQGQPQAAAHAQPPQDVNRLVEQAIEQRFAAAQEHKAASAWQEFTASNPEFLHDVKDDMREILELAARQGRNMTYQQAYDRACKLNEDVASTLAQRKAAEDARTKQQAIARARNAAGSVKSQPTAAPAAQPAGRRAALEAAYDERES